MYVDGLSDEEVKALRIADNKLNESAWDLKTLAEEIEGLDFGNIELEFDLGDGDWFEDRERDDRERQEGNDEYNAFLDKFEQAKTTDDCYTPDIVYDAVAEWVAGEYGLDREKFVRPFYPGGDYQKQKYKAEDVVVDNPPFSILSEIIRFYGEKGVRFFLFAPTLTLFSGAASDVGSSIAAGVTIVYENGATVNTSFVTNLEEAALRTRTAPDLTEKAQAAADEYAKSLRRELPKYSYPDHVITAALLARWSKYGIEFCVTKGESESIDALDMQKEHGKAIYGKGYLLGDRKAAERAAAERAAAERAAATRWELSDRERRIIERLNASAPLNEE